MAKGNAKKGSSSPKKKTTIGNGIYTKKPHSGGETFHGGHRQGTTPSKARRNKKPYRGQGR